MIRKIKKRDGRIVDFNEEKIFQAIWKAVQSVGGKDQERTKFLTKVVTSLLNEKYKEQIPSVENIQDLVEKVLIEHGHAKTAKSFILYRQKRKEIREAKKLIGIEDDTKFSLNALKVLEGRYLQKDRKGKLLETPKQLFQRVAKNIAQADLNYRQDAQKSEQEFLDLMLSQDFMPNSPTLMNAGTELQQLSACFVLPVEDSIEGIFESVKNAAIIHQSGGGTGFSFSRLRPKGDPVKTAGGVASGPISFMKVFNAATEQIKQGGKRRGANMGILRVDHPDILDFITCKEKDNTINNFNISVGITDQFMEAVKENKTYDLINPRNNEIYNKLNAKRVFDLICTLAWKNGDPGLIFLDTINKKHPLSEQIESTNPCGEVPLLPYESCNLGSINLAKHVKDEVFDHARGFASEHVNGQVDWQKLKYTVHTAVHFLDNVIDMNKFPVPKITEMVLANRKIGLGIMGFADMLIKLKIPYNSERALQLAEAVMKFIDTEAKTASVKLAEIRGVFPNFEQSSYNDGKPENKVRNATRTSIAPTGTISIIAGCSSSIEPLFAISYLRKTPQFELLEINHLFEETARQEGFYTEDLMKKIAKKGSIQDVEEISEHVRKIFVTAMDLTPEDHVKIQAAFQKYIDNSVSKTVNFLFTATVEDIAKTYLLAYELGCKGITIYRDGSRDLQVLNIIREERTKPEESEIGEEQTFPVKIENDQISTVDAEYAGGCTSCKI